MDVEAGPFQKVSMDLITDLPLSQGYNSILTIIDQGCSKAGKFIPCNKMITGPHVTQLYLTHLVPWFGLPKCIISDHNPHFMSAFACEMTKVLGIQQNLSTAFHPRTNSQTERMNTWIEQYLHPWTSSQPAAWSKLLPIAEFMHNLWKHDVAHKTLHKLLFGVKLQVMLQHLDSPMPAATKRLCLLDDARKVAQKALEWIQQCKDDRKITEMKEGDQVWLEAQNLMITRNQKLSPKRYGPYQISEKISAITYHLDLPPSMKIHNVFYIDLLLPYKEMEAYGTPYTHPPLVIEKDEEYEVKKILDVQHNQQSRRLEYLVY
jgi:hypothetical protein